jgi:hypothetical protein
MNWCLATQFLTEVGTAVLVKKAKNILRYQDLVNQRGPESFQRPKRYAHSKVEHTSHNVFNKTVHWYDSLL